MIRTVLAAWAALGLATAVFAAEAVADLPFSYDSPVISAYWKRELNKVEAGPEELRLAEECLRDYRQIKPDWTLLRDAVYESADGTMVYFDFQAQGVTDFRIVYVYSKSEKKFLGKFPGSRS